MIHYITRKKSEDKYAVYAWFEAMHTRIDLLLCGEDCLKLHNTCREISSLIAAIEKEGNCFAADSLLSEYNALETGRSIRGGEYLYDMLAQCKYYHRLTNGLFDVTVPSFAHTKATIDSVLLLPGHMLARATSDLKVNLSGFIKGYALDRIREHLCALGIIDAVISLGNSSVMAMGDVPFSIKDACVTTSGNTPGFPHQIIDPRNGTPVSREGTAQVVTKSGAEGEVLATACFIAGDNPADRAMLASSFPDSVI